MCEIQHNVKRRTLTGTQLHYFQAISGTIGIATDPFYEDEWLLLLSIVCLPLSLSVSTPLALYSEQWKKILFLPFSVSADYNSVTDIVAIRSWHQGRLSSLNKQQELVLWLFQAMKWKWVSCVDQIGNVQMWVNEVAKNIWNTDNR